MKEPLYKHLPPMSDVTDEELVQLMQDLTEEMRSRLDSKTDRITYLEIHR